MMNKLQLAFLLSGSGTTLENLLEKIDQGNLDARIQLVLSSDPDAYGLVRARKHDIPTAVVAPDEFDDREKFSEAISAELDRVDPDLICMGGFMHFYVVPNRYRYRVINIHPSLLPEFGGEGFYGHHVHEAVLEADREQTGCSVHFVTNEGYDEGPVIQQETVPVRPNDTPETLEKRVKEMERELYPRTIQLFAEDRVRIVNGKVHVDPAN